MKRSEAPSGWIRARPWVLKLLGAAPVLALLVLFNVTGIRGVDYGFHWDEARWHIAPARHMIATGVLLPQSYIYPSFDKWLVILPSIPRGISMAFATGGNPLQIQAAMLAAMESPGYLLRVRGVFIVLSSLAILWVYGAALALRHRRWEALVAATGVGLSWEYAYHSRWAVTDCVLAQFSALTLLMLALFHRTRRTLWLYGAALAAGLGTGTKYTGVFLLVPVLLSGVLTLPLTPSGISKRVNQFYTQVRRAAALCGLAFAIYLITTPATVLDPFQFLTETRGISTYYMHSHGGYTAHGAGSHVAIVLSYFALAYFSPNPWIAAVLFGMAVVGAVQWLRRDVRFGALVVGFPVLFLLFFCIRYRVVMVRNYLFLVPFLALLMARGIADLARWLPRPWLRWCLAGALLTVLAVQTDWLIAAGESIRHVDPSAYAKQALEYVESHGKTHFRVSSQVRALALAQHLVLPANVTRDGTQVVFFSRAEGPNPWHWKVNDPWLTEAVFGPREVDLNWYISWAGTDHVVVMTLDRARASEVPLAR